MSELPSMNDCVRTGTGGGDDSRPVPLWRRRPLGAALFASFCLAAAVSGCVVGVDPSEESIATQAEELTMCGPESRSAVTTLTYPNGALGRVLPPVGHCTGFIIGPNKIITAQHCTSPTSTGITFQPQFGIATSGVGIGNFASTRFVSGRDDTSGGPGDWAIVTLNTDLRPILGANYQEFSRTPVTTPGQIQNAGYYADLFSARPGKQTCSFTNGPTGGLDPLINMFCDMEGGGSGGPAYQLQGNSTVLAGILTGHGGPTCSPAPTGASAYWFAWVPDNPGGIGVGYQADGRAEIFATDQDWPQILRRYQKSPAENSAWFPWYTSATNFSGGRKISVVNLQDGRRQMIVVMSDGSVKTRWESVAGLGSWSAWNNVTVPAPIKDVAFSGGNGLTTHLFLLTTGNGVYRMNKTGDANSAWTNPVPMGPIPNSRSLAAVYAAGMHRVFVSDASGVVTAEGNGASFSGFVRRGGVLAGGLTAITAGLVYDGRLHVTGATSTGGLKHLYRSTAGSWGAAWTTFAINPPPRVTGFNSMASVRLPNALREQIFAIGSDGNIYTIWEIGIGAYTPAWTRAYN